MLLDGFFNVIRRGTHSALSLLGEHENIELKIYEPLPLIEPWYINNRMHDKIILADGEIVITGGRNIGNKYFDEDHPNASRDRDIMIGGDVYALVPRRFCSIWILMRSGRRRWKKPLEISATPLCWL